MDLLKTDDKALEAFCLKSLDSSKALDIQAISVKPFCSVADTMIIASGTSRRHVSAIAGRLEEHLYKAGYKQITLSGATEGNWVIADLGNVMVHILTQEAREAYDLETLYHCMAQGMSAA